MLDKKSTTAGQRSRDGTISHRPSLRAVQSWRNGENNYAIEYTLDGENVRTEYADQSQWAAILRQLDGLTLFPAT